ncbi:WD40-repeat-containing domain protein [Entophlyctis helioformis]|nr:WD40-repeat-containing domain protein [Entophlyctis helioformis]
MEPIDEILIAKDVKIKTVVRYPESSHDYLVQDQQGHLFRLDLNKRSSDKLLSFHAGSVVGIDTSPISHIMATLGSDGSLSIYDYTSKTTLNRSKFHAGGSCLSFLPEILDSVGKTIVAGFTDGVLRIVSFTSVGMVLQHVFKPHVEPITAIAISADGRLMVTGSDDKTIFLFSVASKQSSEGLPLPFARSTVKITPLGFISVQGAVSKIAISPDEELYRDEFKCNAGTPVLKSEDKVVIGKRLLINLKDGSLYSALVSPNDAIDTALTFEIPATKLRLEPIQLYVPDATVATPLPAGAPGQQGQAADGNPASSAAPGNTQSPAQDASPGENSNGGQFGQDGSAPAGAAATSGDQQAGQQQDGQNDKLPRTKSMIRKAQGVMVSKESSVTATLYLANGFFVAGYVNSDNEAEIRLCHVLMPDRSRLLLAYKVPISDLHLSPSSTYILAGAQDGTCAMIRYNLAELMAEKWDKSHETYIQYSNRFNDRIEMALEDRKKEIQTSETTSMSTPLEVSGQHWFGHGHDILQGRVNALQTSFDESFLCSAGSDGGIFVWRITFESIKSERVFEGDLDEQSNQIAQPEDIVDPSTYSIQEAKVKSEKDREIEQAESKKQVVRNYIQDLRNEFIKLVSENDKQPASKQIRRQDLNVDPYLRGDVERDTLEKITNLHKEMAWISEKESIGPAKLRSKFLDPLQTERIELQAFEASCAYLMITWKT